MESIVSNSTKKTIDFVPSSWLRVYSSNRMRCSIKTLY